MRLSYQAGIWPREGIRSILRETGPTMAQPGFTEGTSTVNFDGSALQTIVSPGGENFVNLSINNTGAGIQLNNNASVATILGMTQGNINLNGNLLTLGLSAVNNGTLNYTAGNYMDPDHSQDGLRPA